MIGFTTSTPACEVIEARNIEAVEFFDGIGIHISTEV